MANLSSNITQVGGNATMQITINDFIKLEQIPINRKSEGRVGKMAKSYEENYESGLAHLNSIVHIGFVAEDFSDPVTHFAYKTGQIFILDGNTRKHYWKKNPSMWQHHKNGLTAIIHQLRNFDQVYRIYNSLDSDKSAKIISEKIQGEFNRQGFYPTQDLLQRGMFGVALTYSHRSPSEPKLALDAQVKSCLSALYEFDSIKENVMDIDGKVNTYTITKPRISRLASAPIYAALMTALRILPNTPTLHEFIKKFISQDENSVRAAINSKKVTPYEIIAIEWLGWSNQRSKKQTDAPLWLDGDAGRTSIQHMQKQLDFLLHWIHIYLENPKYDVLFSNGIKSTAWKKVVKKSDDDEEKSNSGGWESFYKSSSKIKKATIKHQNNTAFQTNFEYDFTPLQNAIINATQKTIDLA